MLSAGELAAMRAELALSLPDLCTRQVRTLTRDGYGGDAESWASTPNVPCRLQSVQRQAALGPAGSQWVAVTVWQLVIRHDQAMAVGNRVALGGSTYEIVAVADAHSERLARVCDLRRVD